MNLDTIVTNWLNNRDALKNHLLKLSIEDKRKYLMDFWVSNDDAINLIIEKIWEK